jgi:hypothetical protein
MRKLLKRILATLLGCLIDLIIILLVVLHTIITATVYYNGKCPSLMDGPATDCSLVGRIFSEVFFVVIFMLIFYWWAVILVLLLPPMIGLIIDLFRNKRFNFN